MPICLVLLRSSGPGASFVLDARSDGLTIGRHISNDVQLDDDRVSRLHARLFRRGEQWCIEDCRSSNGTFVNSQPIAQTLLEPGDLIRIGDRLLLFVDDAAVSRTGEIQTSVFRATTMIGAEGGQPPARLAEQSCHDSVDRVIQASSVLGRLANLLNRHGDSDVLIESAVAALADGIAPAVISIWLAGADGRLRRAGGRGADGKGGSGQGAGGQGDGGQADDHVLASLSVEKRKAIFMEAREAAATDDASRTALVGRSIAVPIPGQRNPRGALECHRSGDQAEFSRADLDFAVVVAQQAGLSLENLEHRERLELANAELRRRVAEQSRLVGSSPAIQRVNDQIARVGPVQTTVLILGESGTGKELVARSIHDASRQCQGPYITVNCAAFSESLLESELFGHEIGAFTGADRRHIGQFERSHRGTIFLDEVGEMSLACQAKLLRILEGHPFQRLGGSEDIRVEVRVLAATHRNLPQLIAAQRFREDLYYRLRVIDIRMPPLRDRGDDILELASMFLEMFRRQTGRGPTRLSSEAAALLRSYHWPGNVRELKNAVERAVVLGAGDEVVAVDLGLQVDSKTYALPAQLVTLREAELKYIQFVLGQCQGNKSQACRILGIGRATLYAKLGEEDRDAI